MATWTGEEIAIVNRFLDGNNGPVTRADLTALRQQLPRRSEAGIKKKIVQARNDNNGDGEDNNLVLTYRT